MAGCSLVCIILCINRFFLERTSSNEANQNAVLNTLKQPLPLEWLVNFQRAAFTPFYKKVDWEDRKERPTVLDTL